MGNKKKKIIDAREGNKSPVFVSVLRFRYNPRSSIGMSATYKGDTAATASGKAGGRNFSSSRRRAPTALFLSGLSLTPRFYHSPPPHSPPL